jgi:hypothetical protein
VAQKARSARRMEPPAALKAGTRRIRGLCAAGAVSGACVLRLCAGHVQHSEIGAAAVGAQSAAARLHSSW